jgi:hypothetical protein
MAPHSIRSHIRIEFSSTAVHNNGSANAAASAPDLQLRAKPSSANRRKTRTTSPTLALPFVNPEATSRSIRPQGTKPAYGLVNLTGILAMGPLS